MLKKTGLLKIFLFLIVINSGQVVHAKTVHNDKTIKALFADKIGPLKHTGTRQYPSPALGYSLSYNGKGGVGATVYVYNLGIRHIGNGARSQIVSLATKQALGDIYAMKSLGYYSSVRPEKISNNKFRHVKYGKTEFLSSSVAYTLNTNNARIRSHVFVTSRNHQLIKVRFSYPLTLGSGPKQLNKFLGGLNSAFK